VYALFLIPVFIVQVTERWYSLQYNKFSKIPPSTSILDDRMTGQNYLDFLQNELPKQLEDVPLVTRIAIYFQHDGAPSHYTRHVMQHLNDTFSNRWIGRGSTINWPPRSPNLTPLDFKKIPIIIWDRTSDLPICNTTP